MEISERLNNIITEDYGCLGTHYTLSLVEVLDLMTDEQIKKMFDNNIDVKYILLDYGKEDVT